jgi:hypothetical protein
MERELVLPEAVSDFEHCLDRLWCEEGHVSKREPEGLFLAVHCLALFDDEGVDDEAGVHQEVELLWDCDFAERVAEGLSGCSLVQVCELLVKLDQLLCELVSLEDLLAGGPIP